MQHMLDPDDRGAAGMDVADRLHQRPAFPLSQAAGDLVEQQKLRPRRERAGQFQALAVKQTQRAGHDIRLLQKLGVLEDARAGIDHVGLAPAPTEGGGGRSEKQSYAFCAEVLRQCELADKANVPAGALTLLDRKRLELARALASDPKLLLLDEIAGGLTNEESAALVGLVRRIRDRGVTIVWIEHVLHALTSIVERLLVLDFGRVIGIGAPDEIMASKEVREIYLGLEV